jgi:hypothetical protein
MRRLPATACCVVGALLAALAARHVGGRGEDPDAPARGALGRALAQRDLAAIRSAVASARAALGARAGEPEVADEARAVPPEGGWLAPREARAQLAGQLERLEGLRWWRVGLDPTRLERPLREPASVVACGATARRARLDGAARALALAEEAAEFLRWAQEQAGAGLFPFPAARGVTSSPPFAVADRFLRRVEADGRLAEVTRSGWLVEDLGDGGLQFDNGECGVALLELHAETKDPRDLAAARRAADWALGRALVPNWNYNAFSVELLARAARATGEARYLDGAAEKALLGVLPGQLQDGPRAGRWLDPHNARPAYHSIMLHALAALTDALPATDARRAEVVAALGLGLRARNADLVAGRATNKDKALEALLLVRRVFAADPAFLRDTRSDVALEALARLVTAEARRGQAPLGPREWALFLEAAASRGD